MKIIVCVKQVPATNEVRMDPVTNTIIREGIESIINPFDTYAIEETLRLKEKHGWETAAISMGIPSVTDILKSCIALGIDEACLLSDRAFAGADTWATAYALARGVDKLGGADLIVCGKMASDGDTAQVGPMLAEMLNIPHATDIAAIEEIKDHKTLVCRKLTDDGYLRLEIEMPALISVIKEINVPRLPSMSGILKSVDTEIPIYTASDVNADTSLIGLNGSPTQVVKTFIPDLSHQSEYLTGTVPQQANALLDRMIGKKIISE